MPQASQRVASRSGSYPLLQYRSSILSLIRVLFLALFNIPALRAAPLADAFGKAPLEVFEEDSTKDPNDPTLWIYLAVAMALVLAGGAFAGLTIALMGQDEIYLQVIETSGEGAERKHAASVLRLLKRGKHWVLVTLLLSNVITNETLPIVLDRSLGGGWPAVLGSTVLIVIFGEIIPQSICVRHGLPIGAWMSAPVLVLMYIMAPVAWPTAKLLDKLLGKDHGTVYKKAGLKTLVILHETLGQAGEQLNSDEVTIISAVLDLKDKPVGSIMTPMEDVFTMSADTVLDENTMDIILSAGYSRIPIHAPDNPVNFVGMLLVKILITYDPEDCKLVRDFALATLPETRPETSCLDIVNYFQEGKSHMVLVTEFPGEDSGASGVVTLEDVIEELIGEEIIDESDVFVDVHKAIRRLAPAPRTRVPKGQFVTDVASNAGDAEERLIEVDGEAEQSKGDAIKRLAAEHQGRIRKNSTGEMSQSPKTTFVLRRTSSVAGQSDADYITKRSDAPELRDQLKHLGPSNLASRPKSTRYASVKIKQSSGISDVGSLVSGAVPATPKSGMVAHPPPTAGGGIGESLLNSAGKDAKDAVHAVQAGYGTLNSPPRGESGEHDQLQVPTANKSGQENSHEKGKNPSPSPDGRSPSRPDHGPHRSSRHDGRHHGRTNSTSTLGSLRSNDEARMPTPMRGARSGSITENIVEAGGFKKVVLEMTSSSEEAHILETEGKTDDDQSQGGQGKSSKKKRRKKRRNGRGNGAGHSDGGGGGPENEPLIPR